MSRLLSAAVLFALLFGVRAPARANEHLSGIVLMTPAAGSAVIHHSSFDGMPAMTMTFRIPSGVRLQPGERISADVDRTSDPWSLAAIQMLGIQTAVRRAQEPAFLQVGDRVPDMTFLDQRGLPLSLQALRGKSFALTFVYTRCADPTMCPLVSAKFRSAQRHLRGAAGLVEISLDPGYDQPPVLARYAASLGADAARWHLLTGDPRRVLDFAARFGILEHSAGPVTIVHSERLAIVDARGRIVRLFDNAAWSPGDVLDALDAQGSTTSAQGRLARASAQNSRAPR